MTHLGKSKPNGSTLLERLEGQYRYRASCPDCCGSWSVGYYSWRDREAPVCRQCSTRTDATGESKRNGSTVLERLPDIGDHEPFYRASCPNCDGSWGVRLGLWRKMVDPTCPACSRRAASEARRGKPGKLREYFPQPRMVKGFEPGTVIGDWTLSGERRRDAGSSGQYRWQATCACGREAWVLGAPLRNGKSTGCGKCGLDPSLPVGYGGAHQRIVKAKGKATSHPCVVCGEPGDDWAYMHSDLFALVAAERRDGPEMPYSTDPDRYQSMCREHHRAYDARLAAMLAGKVKPRTVAELFAVLMGRLPALDLTPGE